MTADKKSQQDRWPPGSRPASKWWMLAKDNNFGAEALIADCGGEQALLVFSGEDEAEMPVWLKGAFEDGWRVRETFTGELVSGMVALDPSPEMAAETIRLVSLSRERFVSWVVDSPRSYSPGTHHNARGLVRLL
jgi:hypothetical protein